MKGEGGREREKGRGRKTSEEKKRRVFIWQHFITTETQREKGNREIKERGREEEHAWERKKG